MKRSDIMSALNQLPTETLLDMMKHYYESNVAKKKPATRADKVFTICTIPDDVQQELDAHERNNSSSSGSEHNQKWVSTLKNLPLRTSPLPVLNAEFLKRCRSIWESKISGLDDIYDKLIEHIVQFVQTGTTRPLLFLGTPGCGKTRVAKVVGEMLNLPMHFANAVQMATGNGLTGHSKTYVAAMAGEVIEGMVRTKCGNPVFVVDEVDKAQQTGGRAGSFQHELLMLTSDESAHAFKDNFIGFPIDASHMFVIMTANELDSVSAPLQSRCDIVRFPEPNIAVITDILTNHTVPTLYEKFNCRELVNINTEAINLLVSTLFSQNINDVRRYQNVIEGCVNKAFLDAILQDAPVTVDETSVRTFIEKEFKTSKHRIGF